MPTLTRVTFKVKADLEIGQNVRLTGDNRSLGSFSPNRGLDLVTTPKEYPIWRTKRPINLPTGVPLSYKFVIMSGGQFHGWETIASQARVIIPIGSEMEVCDVVGVDRAADQDTCAEYNPNERTSRPSSGQLASSVEPSFSGLGEPKDQSSRESSRTKAPLQTHEGVQPQSIVRGKNPSRSSLNIHPHVRFKLDEDTDTKSAQVKDAGTSVSSSYGVSAEDSSAVSGQSGDMLPQQSGRDSSSTLKSFASAPSPFVSSTSSAATPPKMYKNRGFLVEGRSNAADDRRRGTLSTYSDIGAPQMPALGPIDTTLTGGRPRSLSDPTETELASSLEGLDSPPSSASFASTRETGRDRDRKTREEEHIRCRNENLRHPHEWSRPETVKRYRMFLVSFNLPINLYHDRQAALGSRWRSEWNANSISRKSEESVANDHEVTWVGAVTPYVLNDEDIHLAWKLSDEDKAEITRRLEAFNCIPLFLPREVFVDHYVRFCLGRIRDMFHNVLSVRLPNEEMRRLESEHIRRRSANNFSFQPNVASLEEKSKHCTTDPDGENSECKTAQVPRKRDRWEGFVTGCAAFADLVMELLLENSTDRDLVWIHNYPLMLVPQLLRERAKEKGIPREKQPNIVFFLHTPFPTSEIFRTLSARDELLEGVLGADIVGFHTFDHARHFITSCKRFLGLQFHSQPGGRLVVDHCERAVLMAISHVGIERRMLDNAIFSRRSESMVAKFESEHQHKIVIVAMDELTRLKGVPLKLLAFERLLQQVPRYRNKVIFIQHGLHTLEHKLASLAEDEALGMSSMSQDNDRAVAEVRQLCERINSVYGKVVYFKEYQPHHWPNVEQRASIWRTADIMVCTPVMEGLNLLPLEYTFCHRDPAGVVILSEFSAASRVLNGAIRINCYDMEEISKAYDQAICMSPEERNARRKRDCGYITNRSSAAWTRNIINDIEAGIQGRYQSITALDKDIIQGSEYHSVVSFENIVLDGFCQPLVIEDTAKSFEKCSKRLILLDYAGTLAERELGNLAVKRDFLGISKRKLSPRLLEILKVLCADPRNRVFVISGSPSKVLTAAFADILSNPNTPLGLVAHSGVMIRWGHFSKPAARKSSTARNWMRGSRPEEPETPTAETTNEWEYVLPGIAEEWKRWIEAADLPTIFDNFTWRTGGSSWRENGVSTSWQFRQADPEWGGMQAVKLHRELEEAINRVNVPISVTRKKHTVELLPRGVDKGKAVRHVVEELKRQGFVPEFCFCVGDDTSDEPMFPAVLDLMAGAASKKNTTTSAAEENEHRQTSHGGNEHFGHAFTCTVARKPTMAQYYVTNVENVVDCLEAFSSTASVSDSPNLDYVKSDATFSPASTTLAEAPGSASSTDLD